MKMQSLHTLWSLHTYNAAYLSALCLVIIQVSIGCIMRSSQTSGKYTFSTSSSVTISEFFKFLISSVLMVRAARREGDEKGMHELVPGSESEGGEKEREKERVVDDDELTVGVEDERLIYGGGKAHGKVGFVRGYVKTLGMVSVENRYGFAKLALLYALINNTIFVAYKLADPGTIALIRSGVIFITALIMVLAIGADISKIQWTAIIIQLCGLATTQYTPDTSTSYPLSTYMVLLFQVFVSSVAGVYNQSLLKSDQASLHAQNAVLYGCGIVINSIVHLTLSFVTDDEPGFFVGYTNSAAYLVIVSNVFIGLAITAVYKYANAVIKCLATAIATGILLYISPILFGTTMAPLIIPGGLIVFITSWLYMEYPAPKRPIVTFSDEPPRSRPFNFIPSGPKWRNPILLLSSLTSVFIIVFCETMQLSSTSTPVSLPILTSPFNTTLAFIRWNGHRPERVPLIEKYAPFFHTLHLSMPSLIESPHRTAFQNLTHDNWGDGLVTYVQIARTMQLILDVPRNESEPEIGGLLQFHFDVWIDPMDFAEEDYNKMWIAVSRHNDNAGGGPTFLCMKKRDRFSSWVGMAKDRNWQYPLLEALQDLEKANTDYTFDPEEWCTGWSDIYYVPRHLWVDYIYLAAFFGARDVFHEIAVPTIMHILDQSRRKRELSSIVNFIGNCYGGCCAGGANLEDLLSHRCGHKLDYAGDRNVVAAHYDSLDYAASILGSEI
ncbi:nucleotide-sugar transporter-domain-containing protein, partial [Leptodontidium sp. 2 PMI_412]